MKIVVGSDHGGYVLKEAIKKYLTDKGHEVTDVGTDSPVSCNYADYAKKAVPFVLDGTCERGILVCGTGIGISLAANKHKGIRAAVCSDHFSAKCSRWHNDANFLCLGGRVIGEGTALELVDLFVETGFEGGRHEIRLGLVTEIENNQ